MSVLYVVPIRINPFGGPNTRIKNFKKEFLANQGTVIEKNNKLRKSLSTKKTELLYIESATNRIRLVDLICLFVLRIKSKQVVVFIRDIYIELFPEEYTTLRGELTLHLNRISNFFLISISNTVVFPTNEMGEVFFKKNAHFPKRPFTDLPPATHAITTNKSLPDFTKKVGLLYLGSLGYTNSGYKQFLEFSKAYKAHYDFYILSGDKDLKQKTAGYPVILNKVPRAEIPAFVSKNNIGYAFHTRPRNVYDDLTFPIKVFDFLSFQIPFITERHIPICNLLGNDYPLFTSYTNLEQIHVLIQSVNPAKYEAIIASLKNTALNNTYEKRYKKLHSL